MTLQNSIFSITKISISMFNQTLVYKQIKMKSISAPLESISTTTTYVMKICAFIHEKKRVDQSGLVTTITFLRARARNVYHLSSAL